MALSCKYGSFVQNTATGNQAVSGLGFQPKAIIFGLTRNAVDGTRSEAHRMVGFATGATARGFCWIGAANGQATTDSNRMTRDDRALQSYNAGGTTQTSADLVSLDSDGFTINHTTIEATGRAVDYLALGGTDLTNAKAGFFDVAASTGNQAVTGVGFRPDLVLLLASSTTVRNAAVGNAAFTFGAFNGTAQMTNCVRSRDAQNFSDTCHIQRTDRCFYGITSSARTPYAEATFVSLDTDGFTVNWSTVTSGVDVVYLALKFGAGGTAAIGAFNQATTTGTASISGLGITPTGLILTSVGDVTSTSIADEWRMAWGMASGTSERGARWSGDLHNQDTSVAKESLDRTKIITQMTTAATPTTDAAADLSSFDSTGFTLNWSTADATAREVLFVVFGSPNTGAAITVPAAAALTLGGVTPSLSVGQSISPPASLLTLSAPSPTPGGAANVTAPASALTLAGVAPAITSAVNAVAPVGVLTLAGQTPSLVVGQTIASPAALLTLNASAPIVVVGNGTVVAAPASVYSLSAATPSLSAGATLASPASALNLAALAPSIGVAANVTAPGAQLTLAGIAPTITSAVNAISPQAVLTLTAQTPDLQIPTTVTAPYALLTLNAFAPAIEGAIEGVVVPAVPGVLALNFPVPVVTTEEVFGPEWIGYIEASVRPLIQFNVTVRPLTAWEVKVRSG